MAEEPKYVLRITAGPGYDEAGHSEVSVNRPEPLPIKGELADVELNVRIENYRGLPRGSPTTSPYFCSGPHAANKDQYSISLRFTPRQPLASAKPQSEGICGADLQFGNDFDRPIRDKLPSGFSTALSIVRWWIDPGLDGDAYVDKPYLYGPALSSFNIIHVGAGQYDTDRGGLWFDEGGDEQGLEARASLGMPQDSKARMKWALRDDSKDKWLFRYGQTYGLDFFNPYLDFANLTLRLPGFQLPIAKYWDGKSSRRSHQLRYVLRNKTTHDIYLVILFTLYLAEVVNEDGTLKEGAADRVAEAAEGGRRRVGSNGSRKMSEPLFQETRIEDVGGIQETVER